MRVLRFPDLKERKGINFSRMHIDRLEKDGKFPKRVRLGKKSVGWVDQEVDDHIAALAAERDLAPNE
jgi:prophage regulatory protein